MALFQQDVQASHAGENKPSPTMYYSSTSTDAKYDPKVLRFNLQKALYTADCTLPEPCVRLLFIDSGHGEKSKALNDQHNPSLWNLIQTSFMTSFL